MKKITIAIDGYSSCGKSTLAKALAKKLHYIFIDSGAMYRGVTLFAIRNELFKDSQLNIEALEQKLPEINLQFQKDENGKMNLLLNGENVENEIRSMEVASHVSLVSTLKKVREKLVHLQQEMGKKGGVVMDGRDIGSVVFPNAELKIFLTASVEIRTQRRFDELVQKNPTITIEEVKQNLTDRDYTDTHRKESPLIQTEDAILLDNSNLTEQEQFDWVLERVYEIKKQDII